VDDITKKIIDLETRKSVHVSLTRAVHSEFRKVLFDHSLSMQEVFEYFAFLVGENDPTGMSIINEVRRVKRDRALRRVTKKEEGNLYDAIVEVDPFGRTSSSPDN